MRIATLGPAGTFSEVAAGLYQPEKQHKIQLLDSLVSCLDAIGNDCDAAVVPIENLTEGFVSPVVDYLVQRPLHIQAEIRIPVGFQCLANSAEPQQIWAQFVAAGQCNQYLNELGLPIIHTASNALSLDALLATEKPSAAMVPKHVNCPASLKVLNTNIADNPRNETRFVVLSATSETPEFDKSTHWKSSLLLIDDNDHPGLLVDNLQVFAKQQINLTSIVSRPAGSQFGDYHFFIDFDGHHSEPGVAAALQELTKMNNIHWLGSYPAAAIGESVMSLEVIKHEPAGNADAVIIWLHGLGASGNDFVPMTEHIKINNAQVRFLFPHAPQMPVTINQGVVMPAWYDITDMSIDRQIDSQQLRESAAKVHAMIDEQVAQGIDSKRIIIAGFSQGGAVGYEAALTYPKPLAGLMAHSTYFATAADIEINEANAQLPILVQHGTQDPVVPEVLGQKACAVLKEKGFTVTYQTYPMPHSLCMEQVQDMQKWLNERF